MSQAAAVRPRTMRDTLVAAAILALSVGGVLAAFLPWHSFAYGAIEVKGVERLEGKVLVASLALAALLAACELLSGRSFLRGTLVAATALATGAAGFYIYLMVRPKSSLQVFVRKALDGSLSEGILLASLAAVGAFVLALSSVRRDR